MKPLCASLFTCGEHETMERKSEAMGTVGTGSKDVAGIIRRPNDVWVLPASRIKQILRGTFLENPTLPPAMR
jgi:hypothetical protein